jgi:broad specificity phosphatase PhoE
MIMKTEEDDITRLYLIRHGATEWNELGRCQGISDIPLNESGLKQAMMLRDRLMEERIDVIYSSNMSRAKRTAEIIAEPHNKSIQIEEGLREMSLGKLEGLTMQQIDERFKGFITVWRERPVNATIPDGESLRVVQQRVGKAIEKILEKHPGKNILVVSHQTAIITYLCLILGIDLNNFRRIVQQPGAINIIEYRGGEAKLCRLNDISYQKV